MCVCDGIPVGQGTPSRNAISEYSNLKQKYVLQKIWHMMPDNFTTLTYVPELYIDKCSNRGMEVKLSFLFKKIMTNQHQTNPTDQQTHGRFMGKLHFPENVNLTLYRKG